MMYDVWGGNNINIWAHNNILFFTILNTKVLLYYTAYLYTPPIITPHDKSSYIVPVPL